MSTHGYITPVMLVDNQGNFPWRFLIKTIPVVIAVVIVIVVITLIVGPTKEEHYNRNENNTDLPSSVDDAISKGWKPETARYHQNNKMDDEDNIKYISDDGREVIFYSDRVTINNTPEDMGTYNFADPQKDPIGHFFKDMVPYYLWKNSEDDTTDIFDRLFGH